MSVAPLLAIKVADPSGHRFISNISRARHFIKVFKEVCYVEFAVESKNPTPKKIYLDTFPGIPLFC